MTHVMYYFCMYSFSPRQIRENAECDIKIILDSGKVEKSMNSS